MACVYFITHPDVQIDPAIPLHEWKLTPRGRHRMRALLAQTWVPNLATVWCSTERKAIEGAAIIANAIGTIPRLLHALGENDRSATGYLPKPEFETTANAFFANPEISIRGWETAAAAQSRIITAVASVLAEPPAGQTIALVSHGGVGTLLLCHLKSCPISRQEDQPGEKGGNFYCFERETWSLSHGWKPIEVP